MCACGRRCSPAARSCRACHTGTELAGAHPLRTTGRSLRSIARAAGVSYKSALRAASGAPMSRSVARRLASVSGVDLRLLVLGRDIL